MDYATLTDNSGRKADFRNVVLIMTSNAGAKELGRAMVGFPGASRFPGAVTQAVEKLFSPEFRNRLDAVITFRNLDEAVVARIVRKMIGEFSAQLAAKEGAPARQPGRHRLAGQARLFPGFRRPRSRAPGPGKDQESLCRRGAFRPPEKRRHGQDRHP